jgi:Fe-S-cluster containining protein
VPVHRIRRAIVRSFSARERRQAAEHAHAGGHSVIWERTSGAHLVLPAPDEDNPADLALHSILDLGQKRYRISHRGVTKGLAIVRVGPDRYEIVRARIERDRHHVGATREVALDCLACGACCYSNEVVLGKDDVRRFERAGRPELASMPYARRKNGKLVLRLAKDRGCLQLDLDNHCNIYGIRPEMCRTFPAGSECCLSARAEDLGIYDGAPPENRDSSQGT